MSVISLWPVQFKPRPAASPRAAHCLSAMRMGDVHHHGQSQAAASGTLLPSVVSASEGFEHALSQFIGHSRPLIFHPQITTAVFHPSLDADGAWHRVTASVVQQSQQRLADADRPPARRLAIQARGRRRAARRRKLRLRPEPRNRDRFPAIADRDGRSQPG